MLVKNPKFEISAVGPNQYPAGNLPEIVLAGKSNVGKSSFINTMINRKKLARTSSEPGKTRQINFYNIDEQFYFVDLPGYGYSKMSKVEQVKVGSFIEQFYQAIVKEKNKNKYHYKTTILTARYYIRTHSLSAIAIGFKFKEGDKFWNQVNDKITLYNEMYK